MGFLRAWRRTILVVVALVGLYAIFGFFVVPPVARSQIVSQTRTHLHRKAEVGKVRFNPFNFRTVVEKFHLADRDGAPLFDFDRLVVDLELSGIFRRAWRFRVISLEGPVLNARILGDGRLSVADLFEAAPEAQPKEKTGWPRLIVDHLRLRQGRASFTDESRSPAFVQAVAPLELDVKDLITIPKESGDHTLVLGLGKDASLRWSGRQTVEPVQLDGRLELRGIPLARLWDYVLSDQVVVLRGGRGEVELTYAIRQAQSGGLALAMKDASVRASEVVLGPKSDPEVWLDLAALEATGIDAAWPECRASVASLLLRRPKALVRFAPDATLNWAALAPPPAPAAPAPPTTSDSTWTISVASVEMAEGEVVLDDLSVAPPVKTTLSAVGLKLRDVTTDLAKPVPAELTATVNGSGKASLTGTLVPEPVSADLQVKVADLDVTPFQPYSMRLPGAELRKLTGAFDGRLRISPANPAVQLEGTGALTDLQIAGAGEDQLIGCRSARLNGLRLTLTPDRLRLTEVAVDGAEFKIHVDKEGNLNLAQLTVAAEEAAPAAAPAPPAVAEADAMTIDIAKIVFTESGGQFTDESLILPFGTRIHSMHGDIRDFSTRNTAPARMDLEGRVLEEGYFKSSGTLRIADPFAASDISVIFREVALPSLSPYSAQFAGYSMKEGMLDLDVRYQFVDRKLIGDHRVIAKDLVLGPKVEGAKGPGLPVRLAVALLKDKEGRIDLKVPVEGTIDSPEFNYRSVFWQAFKKILANVATAPFRAIGRAFGADDEELELVGFAAGASVLPVTEDEKLHRIAAEVAGREGLSLEIEGRFDRVADTLALRRTALEARIDAKRTPESNLDQILETLYTETFSAERLEAERLKASATEAGSAFYEDLQRDLQEAQPVEEGDLTALAQARAQAISAALTAPGGLDAARVTIVAAAPVKRKKQGSELVPSEMTMSAKDE